MSFEAAIPINAEQTAGSGPTNETQRSHMTCEVGPREGLDPIYALLMGDIAHPHGNFVR